MTEFNDVPATNALYNERMLVDQAIRMLDNGGNMTSFVIEQSLPLPGASPIPMEAPARITIPPPTPDEVRTVIRSWLVQRQADLDAQLAALGVTDTPVRRV